MENDQLKVDLPGCSAFEARDDLAAGHVDAALAAIARLPGRKAATAWIASARRYVQARVALDRIETAALLQPANNPD